MGDWHGSVWATIFTLLIYLYIYYTIVIFQSNRHQRVCMISYDVASPGSVFGPMHPVALPVCVCVFYPHLLYGQLVSKKMYKMSSCKPLAPAIQSGNIGKCIDFIKLWNPCSMGFVVPGRSRKNVHVHIARSCYCITEVDMGSTLPFQEAQVDEIVSKEWWMIGIASDYLIICHGSHGPLIYRQ